VLVGVLTLLLPVAVILVHGCAGIRQYIRHRDSRSMNRNALVQQ
jgi:hypothetical protein